MCENNDQENRTYRVRTYQKATTVLKTNPMKLFPTKRQIIWPKRIHIIMIGIYDVSILWRFIWIIIIYIQSSEVSQIE